jgi:hypothetical protein
MSYAFEFATGLARTLPDGSSTALPKKEPTGVVGVTAARSAAEEFEALDTNQGQRPWTSTIWLEASRRLRHSSRRLRRKRDGGSQFEQVENTERTRLAEGEGWKRERAASGTVS